MNTLLSFAHGILSYRRGQQTGITGLFAIALVIFLAYQWDYVVAVLEFFGIIGFLDRQGVIYEDASYLTGYALFMVAFRATIIFCVLGAIVMVLGIIIAMFGSSKLGMALIGGPILLISIPFMIIFVSIKRFFMTDEEKAKLRDIHIERKKTVLELVLDSSEQLSIDNALLRLNRLPTTGDTNFLVAVTINEEFYLLLPKPAGVYFDGLPSEKLNIEKILIPLSEDPTKVNGRLSFSINKDGFKVNELNQSEIAYYLTFNKDELRNVSREVVRTAKFKEYMTTTIDRYFNIKESLLKLISEAQTKEEFDTYVERVNVLSAINEDIIKMMKDSEKPLQI